jgi:hypothetical protein
MSERPARSLRRSRDEDEDEDDRFDVRAEYPRSVWAAGVIWIIFGGLILLGAAVNLVVTVALKPAQAVGQAGDANPGSFCGILFGVFVGAVFVHVGVQSVNGTAKDTLGNGIGSLIFALLYAGVGALLLVGALALGGPAAIVLVVIGAVNILSGLGLLTGGVLALMGRSDYKAWRRGQKARSRRDD